MAAPFSSAVTHGGNSSRTPALAPLKHWVPDATANNLDPFSKSGALAAAGWKCPTASKFALISEWEPLEALAPVLKTDPHSPLAREGAPEEGKVRPDDFKVAFFSVHDPLDASSIQCEGIAERKLSRASSSPINNNSSSNRFPADAVPRLRGRAADAKIHLTDRPSPRNSVRLTN